MALDWERRGLLPKGLSLEQVELTGNRVLVHAVVRSTAAACPQCGRLSRQVHSRYRRGLTDLPAHGREVKVLLAVRRFRCRTSRCRTAIFAERFSSEVTSPHARRTSRLQGLVLQLGLMLGGQPAQALAERLLLPVSKDTFLRSVRAASRCTPELLRVIGIDDWAWRRGRRYGTLICDLERRRIVDLLPDREPATVEAQLDRHPGIKIVARDRDGGYARAVSRAIHPGLLTGAERLLHEGFLRRQQTNSTVRRMAGDSLPIKQIVRMTELSRNLVRQILRGEREDAFRLRQSSLEPWLPWLTREWESGCRNGAELWRRLRTKGFGGSLRVVGEWATRQRRAEASAYSAPGKCPSARRIARMMTTARDHISRSDAVTVARIEAAVPDLAAACVLTGRFANMVRKG